MADRYNFNPCVNFEFSLWLCCSFPDLREFCLMFSGLSVQQNPKGNFVEISETLLCLAAFPLPFTSLLLLAPSESLHSAVFSLTPSSCSTIQNVPPRSKLSRSCDLVYLLPFSWGPLSYTFCCPMSKKNVYLFYRLLHVLYTKT